MFGSKERKIERMVLKAKWDKLNKMLAKADADTRLLIATECQKATNPGVNSILSLLIRDGDKRVQIAAIKSLGVTGTSHEASQLDWLLSNTPEDQTDVIEAIHESLPKIRGKR